jgi:glycosyltransferase involved in cell wall biosynthesis
MILVNKTPLVSIILPVFNRIQYLEKAIKSVFQQTYWNWEFIIADDGSSQETKNFIKQNTYENSKTIIYSNQINLGLFQNLNCAIRKSKGDLILILCSDDYLVPECLERNINILQEYSQAELVLSSFQYIDKQNNFLPTPEYADWAKQTVMLEAAQAVRILLKDGSINGNITGMTFSRKLFDAIGGFREDWKHAADWEWIYRAACFAPIIVSRENTAVVRVHDDQLSGINFNNLSNTIEVSKMISILLTDPHCLNWKESRYYAQHIMQLHLWYAIKFAVKGQILECFIIMRAINKVTGLVQTFLAMLLWLPTRWKIHRYGNLGLTHSKENTKS